MPRDHDHDQTVTPIARITLFLVVAALLAGVGGGTVALSIPSDATASVRPVIRQPEQSSGAGAPTDTEAASKRILQSVVQVQTGGGSGSGFVMDDDGHVITNHHLIAGSTRVTLVLPDGSTALGRVIGSDDVRIGEQVIAVGSPLGLNGTLTAGGPLVDLDGRVIEVNSSMATLGRQAGNVGIGFAIPVDDAAAIAERIIAQ
jgi:putative serine protease PepD